MAGRCLVFDRSSFLKRRARSRRYGHLPLIYIDTVRADASICRADTSSNRTSERYPWRRCRARAHDTRMWRYRYIRIIRSDFARIHCPRHACHLFTLNRLIKLWPFSSLSSSPSITPRHATKINPESVGAAEDDTFDRYDHVPKTNSPLIDVNDSTSGRLFSWILVAWDNAGVIWTREFGWLGKKRSIYFIYCIN